MDKQFESLKRAFAKQIKEHGYTKTTEDLKKHCEKLKQALKEARHEASVEKRRVSMRKYNRQHYARHVEEERARCKTYYYEVQKKQRQKDRIVRLEAKLKELKERESNER